jgi:membrane associated rhomboid family serine protease
MDEAQHTPPAENTFFGPLLIATPRVWATWVLVIANVAYYGLMVAKGVHFIEPTGESLLPWGANYPPRTTAGEWWRLGSAMFIHFGVIHLAMNMVVLVQIGPFVERLYGNVAFMLAYLLSGLMASLASIVFHSDGVCAGASGAVFGAFGLLVAYVLKFKGSIPAEVSSRLLRNAGTFLGINFFYGITRADIDMSAHVAGMAAGLVLGFGLALPIADWERRGRRNLGIAIAAAVLVIGGAAVMPHPVDMRAEYKAIEEMEARVLDRYNNAVKSNLSDEEFAKVLETKVLPEWREYRARLDSHSLRGSAAEWREHVSRYMRDRQAGWELMLDGLKVHDAKKVKDGSQKIKMALEEFEAAQKKK